MFLVPRNQCRSLSSRPQNVQAPSFLCTQVLHRWAVGAFGVILGKLLLGAFGRDCTACPETQTFFLIDELWI